MCSLLCIVLCLLSGRLARAGGEEEAVEAAGADCDLWLGWRWLLFPCCMERRLKKSSILMKRGRRRAPHYAPAHRTRAAAGDAYLVA